MRALLLAILGLVGCSDAYGFTFAVGLMSASGLSIQFTSLASANAAPVVYSGAGIETQLTRAVGAETVKQASGGVALFEERAASAGGVWTHGAFTNVGPKYDMVTGFTQPLGGCTITADAVTAPDGTSDADKIDDTSGAITCVQRLQGTLNGAYVTSAWARDVVGDEPTACGRYYNNGVGGAGGIATCTAGWTRYVTFESAVGTNYFDIFPAGSTVAGVNTNAETGAKGYYAAQYVVANVDYEYANGAASASTIRLAARERTQVVRGGNLDVTMCARMYLRQLSDLPDSYFWWATSADGEVSVRYTTATSTITFKVRGSDIDSAVMPVAAYGDEFCTRAQYNITTGKYRLNGSVNGATQMDETGNTTGSALANTTDAYIGSNAGTSAYLPALVTRFQTGAGADQLWEGLWLGDSIQATTTLSGLSNEVLSSGSVYTALEARTRPGIYSLAVPGDKIEDQATRLQTWYNNATAAQRAAIKFLVLFGGVNNVGAGGQTATVAAGHYQTAVTLGRSLFPTAKIVVSKITPAKTYLDGLGANNFTHWTNLNTAISGSGADAITGYDAYVSASSSTLDNNSGVLLVECDVGDAVHVKTRCKRGRETTGLAITPSMVAPIRTTLTAQGVLP